MTKCESRLHSLFATCVALSYLLNLPECVSSVVQGGIKASSTKENKQAYTLKNRLSDFDYPLKSGPARWFTGLKALAAKPHNLSLIPWDLKERTDPYKVAL